MSSSGEGGTSRVEHHGCAPRVGHAGAAEVVGRDGAASVATHGVPLAQPRRIEHEAASRPHGCGLPEAEEIGKQFLAARRQQTFGLELHAEVVR
jgi:hypothetical protein